MKVKILFNRPTYLDAYSMAIDESYYGDIKIIESKINQVLLS